MQGPSAPPPSLVVLKTERLILRRPVSTDIEPLLALWADPRVTRFLGGPRDSEKIRPLIERDILDASPKRLALWTLAERATGDVVGDCGFVEKEVDGRPEIEVIYLIAFDRWNRGYATEVGAALLNYAATALGLSRVIALIDPENLASEVVTRRIGMVHERLTVRPGGKSMRVYAWPAPLPLAKPSGQE